MERQARILSRWLHTGAVFLEPGPGECAPVLHVAKMVKHAVGIDVSPILTASTGVPANFELFMSDGSSVLLACRSVDVACSDQRMEHLHPEDAVTELKGIFRCLAPGVAILAERILGCFRGGSGAERPLHRRLAS